MLLKNSGLSLLLTTRSSKEVRSREPAFCSFLSIYSRGTLPKSTRRGFKGTGGPRLKWQPNPSEVHELSESKRSKKAGCARDSGLGTGPPERALLSWRKHGAWRHGQPAQPPSSPAAQQQNPPVFQHNSPALVVGWKIQPTEPTVVNEDPSKRVISAFFRPWENRKDTGSPSIWVRPCLGAATKTRIWGTLPQFCDNQGFEACQREEMKAPGTCEPVPSGALLMLTRVEERASA